MTGCLIDARHRLIQRQLTWEKVERYELSVKAITKLRAIHGPKPVRLESVQRMLLTARSSSRIRWRDLVFYIIVERGVASRELIPELHAKLETMERDFVYCCESRRKADMYKHHG